MIEIEHLSVAYGANAALRDLNLAIAEGECVLITGPSGCGKSTLACCLNGLIPHAVRTRMSGRVTVDGLDTARASVAELACRVGHVFQEPSAQFFNLTVEEEIAFGPRNLGLDEREIARRVDWVTDVVEIAGLRLRTLNTLSGGEQQRAAIASVLAMRPRILVLDEPASRLDVASTAQLIKTLRRLNESGMTIAIIEHRLGAVAQLAHRTVVLDEGQVVADGPTAEVLGRRDLLRRLGLRRPADELQNDWRRIIRPANELAAPVVAELRGVSINYGDRNVLNAVDLRLHEGEFVALVGDNGAGKSTLARILAGLTKPRRGTVHLNGGAKCVLGRDIGLLFQNPLQQLFCDSVREEVELAPRNFDCMNPAALTRLMAAADLDGLSDRPVFSLSRGQQQRVALAAVAAPEPRLIILDEPTIGQDWAHLSALIGFLQQRNQVGATILLITHDYKLVHHYAGRIVLLRDGRIAADGVPANDLSGES